MQKSRMVNTKIWDDDYFANLDPSEKLIFLYFLTNTSTNIAGIYEIPLKKVALETGLDKEMVVKIIDRFTKDGKVFYLKGWLCMKNFVKNQKNESPTVKIGIKNEIALVPKDILDEFIGYGYGIDTISHLIQSNLIKPKKKIAEINSAKIPLLIKEFESINPTAKKFYNNKTQRAACEFLIDTYGLERVIQIIKVTLPKTNGIPYFPTITTPQQLQLKFAMLESAIRKHQTEKLSAKEKYPVI